MKDEHGGGFCGGSGGGFGGGMGGGGSGSGFDGKLITFEIGLRFLTDWLEGDTYFKIKRPTHNLDRARTQFKLVESIEAQLPAMQALVARA